MEKIDLHMHIMTTGNLPKIGRFHLSVKQAEPEAFEKSFRKIAEKLCCGSQLHLFVFFNHGAYDISLQSVTEMFFYVAVGSLSDFGVDKKSFNLLFFIKNLNSFN